VKRELQSRDGISLSDIKYPRTQKHRFAFGPGKLAVNPPGESLMKFRLRSDPKAPLGRHPPPGKISFRAITDTGITAPQQLNVQIPLTVVAHDAAVGRSRSNRVVPSDG
jgi:hypothetical protein